MKKEDKDDATAELVASGVKPIRNLPTVGQNLFFAGYKDASDPDACLRSAGDRARGSPVGGRLKQPGLHTENNQPAQG